MKNLFIYSATFILAAIMISLTACEQDDLSIIPMMEKSYDDDGNYIFENPDWVLIQEDYVNENGSVGSLYENANNPIEIMFEVRELSSADNNKLEGTWGKYFSGGQFINYTCQVPKKDCYVLIERNDEGEATSVEIFRK